MKKIYWLLIMFFLIGSTTLWSQAQHQREIDSLLKKLPLVSKDTNRVNLLAHLAYLYSFKDSINSFNYANEAIQLSKFLQFKPGFAGAYRSKANYYITKRIPQKAISFIQQEATIWEQLKNTDELIASYIRFGQVYSMQNKFDTAISYYKKAENISLKLNNSKALGAVYHGLGTLYSDKSEPENAIGYLIKSLQIQEATHDTKTIGSTQNNLGRLFFQTKNYSKAIAYYTKSLEANTLVKDWLNLGITHVNLANVYIEETHYEKALIELDKSLELFKQVGFKRGMQVCYNNLGALNLRQANYEPAIGFLKKGLDLAKENQTKLGVALIEQNIGYSYTHLKEYPEALKWFESAEQTAAKFGADDNTLGEIYNHRSSLDSLMGNFGSALVYRTKYVRITEKATSEKVIRQVNELQTQYETEKKQLRINLLNKSDSIKTLAISNQQLAIQQNQFLLAKQDLELADASLLLKSDSLLLLEQNKKLLQSSLDSNIKEDKIKLLSRQRKIDQLEVSRKKNQITIGIIGAALLALIAYGLYRRNKIKQQKAYQEKLMLQQEQSTIDIITAEEKERKRIASDLHDGVGQLMSATWMNLQALNNQVKDKDSEEGLLLQKCIAMVDESCKEVRQVSHNMMPNALLMKGLVSAVQEFIGQIDHRSLNINLTAEGLTTPIPSHIETVLYRVIQESVNNVIKHAKAAELDISIIRSSDGIDVMIEDNGKGFNPKQLGLSAGIGLQNIKLRIQYLQGTVEWNSGEGKGTLVAIYIPLNEKNQSAV